MKTRLILFAEALCGFAAVNAQMLDVSAGAEKKITKKLAVTGELDYRTLDALDGNQRFGVEVGAEYNLTKWLKGMASYSYISKHYTDEVTSKGNALNCYWRNNNRINVALQGGLKVNRLSISLREGFQYTHVGEATTTKVKNGETKVKSAKDPTMLRSRLKLGYNIKRSGFAPYVSVEAYNDTKNDFEVAKMRYTLGTDYKICKGNTLTLFYRYTDKADEDDTDGHMIGVGYTFKMK